MSAPHRPGAPERVWIFAVDHDAVQLTWRRLGPGPVTVRVADTVTHLDTDGGPGAVTLRGLDPGRPYRLSVTGPDAGVPPGGIHRRFRTLDPPPGPLLARFATVSDLHIGETRFGYFGTMHEQPPPTEPHPVRATRAALTEIAAAGAELVVIKGDCTSDARVDEWEQFGKLLAEAGLPWEAIPGNHDSRPVDRQGHRSMLTRIVGLGPIRRLLAGPRPPRGEPVDWRDGFRRIGYEPVDGTRSVDVDGLRIVLADTTTSDFHRGSVARVAPAVIEAAADARRDGRPVLVAGHHYPMLSSLPHFWPPGFPAAEAAELFPALRRANPAVLYTAGHTHRHRRYRRHGVMCTEVGSPKDYPGTWASYAVYEGGITQVVWRVAAPDVVRWTDYSRGAAGGTWGLWSPGLRDHRCFHHRW